MTYQQIATELGVSVSTAYESAMRGMQAVPTEGVVEAKRLELLKLDVIERRLFGVLGREHAKVDHGRKIMDLVKDPQTGEVTQRPMLDDGPVIQAATALLRVQERRAKLLGLDAPAQHRVEVITDDMLDAEIRFYEAKFAENDRKAAEGFALDA